MKLHKYRRTGIKVLEVFELNVSTTGFSLFQKSDRRGHLPGVQKRQNTVQKDYNRDFNGTNNTIVVTRKPSLLKEFVSALRLFFH